MRAETGGDPSRVRAGSAAPRLRFRVSVPPAARGAGRRGRTARCRRRGRVGRVGRVGRAGSPLTLPVSEFLLFQF